MDAAASGRLATSAGRLAELDRMLKAPKGRVGFQGFLFDFLGVKRAALDRKHTSVLAGTTPTLLVSMQQELRRFVEDVVFERAGSYRELLTAPFSYVNADLRPIYGLASGGAGFEKVSLDAGTGRLGLLTQPLVLTAHTKEIGESPIQMGMFIRTFMMCQPVAPPPSNVNTQLPTGMAVEGLTEREKFQLHSKQPICASCHRQFDPPGFAYSPYDPIGRYSVKDAHGRPFDTKGTLHQVDDGAQEFVDAVDMIRKLGASRTAADCFALQLYRWVQGYVEGTADAPAIERLQQTLWRNDTRVVETLTAFIGSDDFVRERLTTSLGPQP